MSQRNQYQRYQDYPRVSEDSDYIYSPRTSEPTNKRLSKVSTQSNLSSQSTSYFTNRRLSEAQSTGRYRTQPEDTHWEQRPQPPTIFHLLSTLLQSEQTFLAQYKQKLESAKNKVTTTFQHLKDDLRLILEAQQLKICEQLNEKYKSFITLFQTTKNQIHRLYQEKSIFFTEHDRVIGQVAQHQNQFLRNKNVLNQMRAQNSQAIYARKYQAFFEQFRSRFDQLAQRKREIDIKLQEQIFDYSGNVGRLKILKEEFARASQGVFRSANLAVCNRQHEAQKEKISTKSTTAFTCSTKQTYYPF